MLSINKYIYSYIYIYQLLYSAAHLFKIKKYYSSFKNESHIARPHCKFLMILETVLLYVVRYAIGDTIHKRPLFTARRVLLIERFVSSTYKRGLSSKVRRNVPNMRNIALNQNGRYIQ